MSEQEKNNETTTTKTAETEEKQECVWNMGTPCDNGAIQKKLMFNKQLDIPICSKHYTEHLELMALHGAGYDIEELVDMQPDERKKLALTLILSGVELDKVVP